MSNELLATTFGTLLSTNEDATNYVTKARTIWMHTILELFKTIILKHPKPIAQMKEFDGSQLQRYYDDVLDPIITEVNDSKTREIKNIISLDETTPHEDKAEADYFDFSSEISVTRLSNPMITDICPDIKISEDAFMEHAIREYEESSGISFPHEDVPIITIYPSISGVFNYKKMYSQYIDSERNKKRESYSAVIEISRSSLMRDVNTLLVEYDEETKTFTDIGISLLRDIVLKYVDFIIPMICINLRKDYSQYTQFISNTYNQFCNNYQSSMRLQRDMYLIFSEVISSPLGVNLAFVHASQFATSSVEFLNPNYKYGSMLTELDTLFEKPYLISYMDRIRPYMGGTYTPLTEMYRAEIQAYSNIISSCVNRMFDYIVTYFNTNGGDNKLKNLQTLIGSSLNSLLESMAANTPAHGIVHSTLPETIKKFIESLNWNNLHMTLQEIAKKMNRVLDVNTPGNNSNRAALGSFPVIDEEILARNYTFMGSSSAATENTDILKDIYHRRSSTAGLRKLATRHASVSTYEQAMGILLDCNTFMEAYAMSTATENADAIEFKTLLLNSIFEAERNVAIFKDKDQE